MAYITLSVRDLLCSILLLLKLALVLCWFGITQPSDFVGSCLILSNMLLIDRMATPVDPRIDSNALLCLVFGTRIFQVLRTFSGLPLSFGYKVLSCITATSLATIGLLVTIEACQASRAGSTLHPRLLQRSAHVATFCCFMAGITLLLVPAEIEPLSVFAVRATVIALLALMLQADWDVVVVGPRRFLICLPALFFLPVGIFWIFALLFVFFPLVDEMCHLSSRGGEVKTESATTAASRHHYYYCRTPVRVGPTVEVDF